MLSIEDEDERLWYAYQAIEYGWSRNAARSMLPLVLSTIMNYARQVAAEMRQLYLSSAGNHIDRDQLIAW